MVNLVLDQWNPTAQKTGPPGGGHICRQLSYSGGNKDLTRKKILAERFLLIWYPRDPTYDQKNPREIRLLC